MNPLRVAVIGAGHLGRIHARLLRSLPTVALVGVADPIEEARCRVAAEFETRAFASHRELLGEIDAAIVATTTQFHASVGAELLAHGIHVLLEKPITATVAEADRLVALADANQCVLQVGHVERFNGAWIAATPFLRQPRYIEAVRTSSYTFRSTDISVVLDLMIHDLDLILSIVDSDVVDVQATGATVFGPHEDLAHAHLRFANGCLASLNTARTSFQAQRTMQVMGEGVYVGIDFAAPSARVIRPSRKLRQGQFPLHPLSAAERQAFQQNLFTEILPTRQLKVQSSNAIEQEQLEFVRCIQRHEEPRCSGRQARDHLRIAERILAEIQTRAAGQPSFGGDHQPVQPTMPIRRAA